MSHFVISPDQVNEEALERILDDAAIHFSNKGHGVYVSGYPGMNFWAEVDNERNIISFITYCDASKDADELEVLKFINEFSVKTIMVQMSFSPEMHRIYGAYYMFYSGGLVPKSFLKACQNFSSIMQAADEVGMAMGILMQPDQESEAQAEGDDN